MRRISVLFCVIALVGAACGSDSEPSFDDTAATTAAPVVTTTEAPVVTTTTAAPVVTTTTAAPIVTTTTAAPAEEPEAEEPEAEEPEAEEPEAAPPLPGVVEGTLLEGATPETIENLVSATNTPAAETCPGTAIFSGVVPIAYSAATWARDTTTGPFLDVWAAQFESVEVATQAIADYDAELIACGEFVEPSTSALGAFAPGENPGVGDESYGYDYAGIVSGFPVNRYSIAARVGDTVYQAGFAALFVEPDAAAVLHSINALLGP